MKKILALFVVLPCLSMNTLHGQSFWSDRFSYDRAAGTAYEVHEFSLDILGGYATRDKRGHDKDAFGIGAGVNYFFTRNIGVGADTYADAFNVPYLLNASGIFRYPIPETGFAPYAFGGFGRQWEYAPQWTGHLGLGLEFRINARTGVFLDARRVFAGQTSDYALWRAGVRLGF